MASQHPDIEKVLFTQEDIDGIVSRLGEQITRDYAGKDLVLIAVLRGAVVFMGDLMRKIELPTNIDFMAVSSYGDSVCCLIDSDSDTGRNDDGFSSNSRHCLLPLSYHT